MYLAKGEYMNKFLKISIPSIVVALIATLVVFLDSLIAPIFLSGASFVWIAFINWTVFFNATVIERIKALIGYIIGFWVANFMILFGSIGGILSFKIINISIATLLGVFIANLLVMYLDKAKKVFLNSIPGIFIGISITFSGAGIKLIPSSLEMFWIIMIYGILGLLCGFLTNFFTKKLALESKE